LLALALAVPSISHAAREDLSHALAAFDAGHYDEALTQVNQALATPE